MLDDDNIISSNVSETVEKIPTNGKDYHKWLFMHFSLYSHSIGYGNIYNLTTLISEDIL